ncbi:MAG TPA: hypothetical protein VFT23_15765 [Burkholderiales bacterium]|nr:hypothetical protein [Burkholderiales bacterium]
MVSIRRVNCVLGLTLAAAAFGALAQEQEIQRALIQRDQQSAEFAARVRGADTTRLEQLHSQQLRDAGRPLDPDPRVAHELMPYERQRMADERVLVLPPPVVRGQPAPENEPRPITPPSRPRTLVDPIPAQTPY